MAYYENLPIYKKSMELAVYMENVVRNFSRYHKYTVGTDMRDLSKNLVTLVIKANSRKDKRKLLTELRDKSEEIKVSIIIGKEIKVFRSFKQFEHAASGKTMWFSNENAETVQREGADCMPTIYCCC